MFNKKRILITGGSGSWGNELTKQLLKKYDPTEILIYSRGEMKQWQMKKKFFNNKLKFVIGDVRDYNRLNIVAKKVDIIFHLAALKHVPVCEENSNEAVLTNIYGAQNVINAAINNNIELVVNVSSDKAVDPLNLYGVTKLCAEKLMIAANNFSGNTKFINV
ncbi:MAG: polysaccharide biosynthesis protein, partial [Candidatus Hodarchaeota archaeon]